MTARAVRVLVPALALAVAACDAPTIPPEAGAYEFTFQTTPPSVVRWPVGKVIRVYVAGGEDPARAALLREAFLEAAAQWESAVLFGEYRFAEAATPREADVVLYWNGDPVPVDTWGCPPETTGARALTWSCPDPAVPGRLQPFTLNGEPTPVRMMVYVARWEASTPASLKRVVLHELGHVLGIGRHSPNPEDAMEAHAPVDRLSPADRATVQVLYHVEPDIVP
ncbi:MAG: matrixin family metalloprotease [bacterium]|jgi:hypothetical protein